MVTDRVPIAPTMLLETADDKPAIVTNALEQSFRGIPGIAEHIGRATAQAMAGMADHSKASSSFAGPPVCQSRTPSGTRSLPSVHTRRSTEKPSTGRRSWREKPHAHPALAVAKGFGITVSSMIRTPRSQTNSVRQATSRRVCPDQSPCSILVMRACATVLSASASATPLPDVRS
jgi:hypothetical protein